MTTCKRDSIEMRPVFGYEGLYAATETGDIISLARVVKGPHGTRKVGQRVLATATDSGGYQKVCLSKDGVATNKTVHVLVCEAFHGPRPDGMEVRHLDGNPANNVPDNLCWGTKHDQILDRIQHGTTVVDEQTVMAIYRSADTSAVLADRYGVCEATISHIRTGARWGHITGQEYAPQRRPQKTLTRDEILDIYYYEGTHQEAASLVDTSYTTAYRIRTGQRHADITGHGGRR